MLCLQICPPGFGLSSIKTTSHPDSAAVTAAAMPAGPPPMTATSTFPAALPLIATDLHSFTAKGLTTPLMWLAINIPAAFKTRAHAADRRTPFAGDRDAACALCVQDRNGDARANWYA